ncbi:prolipoprotein diacylglyceryl transferase [Tersicoccus phoenicis]|uniref:prolipoprotein diacylglyceryl transferase n=1 Tax=Tersicoccus phoenicis TaxID=554083 RepID=UPI000A04F8EC|nr:prolipoprotein diacylglyceryl transferase [Tersicoccus phoenicis]
MNALSVVASIPSPNWSGFTLGPFSVKAYALCILAGIVVGLLLTRRRWLARGGDDDSLWSIAVWAIPAGIIGGRLYHVFSSPDAYFGPGFNGTGDLWLIPQIWRGGLGIWGAVLLGFIGAWIGARRAGARILVFADAAAPGLLLAQAIGRLGNWFNQELFGGPTTLPWGLQIDPSSPTFPADYPAGTLFHPTFLYELLWNLAGVAVLLWADRRFRLHGGRLFWLYAAIYTLGRVWIEALRIDDAELILGFRLNVWTSILVFAVAVAMFWYLGVRQRRHPPAERALIESGADPGAHDVDNGDRSSDASPSPDGPDGVGHRATLGATESEQPAAADERRRS